MPDLHFRVRGEGHPVILLHGFPMNSKVWNEFADDLAKDFKVYTVDLPGFGKSPLLNSSFSIDDVANCILHWISQNQIIGSVVIGHSLGGYVVLSIVQKKPEWFAGIGLFHSTAYADSSEKKEARTKVVEFINKNGVLAFTSNFIQPLFAEPSHGAIEGVKKIAMEASKEAVIGYTLAMRDRPDRLGIIKDYKNSVLFISGEKDAGIPPETILYQASQVQRPEIHILNKVAHMGMFENKEESLGIVRTFLKNCMNKA